MSKVPDIVDKAPSSPNRRITESSFTAAVMASNRPVRTIVQKSEAPPAESNATAQSGQGARNSKTARDTNTAHSPRPRRPNSNNTSLNSAANGISNPTPTGRPVTTRVARSAPGTAKASQRRTVVYGSGAQQGKVSPASPTTPSSPMNQRSLSARHVDPNNNSAGSGGLSTPRAMSPVVRPLSPATRGMQIPSQSPTGTAPTRVRSFNKIDSYKSPVSSPSATVNYNSYSTSNYSNTGTGASPGKKIKHKPTSEDVTVVESKRVNQLGTQNRAPGEPYKVTLTPSDTSEIIHAVYHENRRGKRVVCMYLTRYSVLRTVAKRLGYVVEESLDYLERYTFYMCWSDTVLSLPALVRFSNWQRSNHFPSMYLLCRKGHLGATLAKLHNLEPAAYRFYPRTWLMRTQKEAFRRVLASKEETTKYFIMKPNSGCQGRGIIVTKDPFSTTRDLDHYIVQEYIKNPLLLEGKKFDLRVYVLLTSIREPSIFIFEDGLVRICTDPYEAPNESNVRNACKHLTNYAVNKRNPNFVFNTDMNKGDVGNKRNFKFFNNWMEKQGHNPKLFWQRVGHVITKTILAAQPQIANVYNSCFPIANEGYTCFEVLGFDILVDDKLKPWLLEVNHTPSFQTDTPLDMDIKSRLLSEVWDVIDIQPADWEKDMLREQYEYTRRSLPPWANNHPIYSKHLTVSAAASATNRRDQVVINPSQVPPSHSAQLSNPLEVPQYVVNRRAQEDAKLRGFTRVYPSNIPEYEESYRRIRVAALKAWSNKTDLRSDAAGSAPTTTDPTPAPEPQPAVPKTTVPKPAFRPSPIVASPPEDNKEPLDAHKSMSRPMPTEEELKWLQDLQQKLDELSEDDPNPEDLEDDGEEEE